MLRDIHRHPKNIVNCKFLLKSSMTLSKVYTSRPNDDLLQSCVLDTLSRHTNIMIDKWFDLFDACAVKYIHLSPQEEKCTSSSWGDSKIYTSASIALSPKMLTKVKDSGAIAKIRIWVESDTVKYLKAFRISFSEIQILLFILSWYFYISVYSEIFFTFIWAYVLKLFK